MQVVNPGQARLDHPVWVAAIRSGCDVLVSGDRTHFGAGFGRGPLLHSIQLRPRALHDRVPFLELGLDVRIELGGGRAAQFHAQRREA